MQKQQWTKNGKSSRRSQHGSWRKSTARRRFSGDTNRQKKVHFATCHLKNAEVEPKLKKYNGSVVSWEGIVTDDFGAYAVFIEQCSFA